MYQFHCWDSYPPSIFVIILCPLLDIFRTQELREQGGGRVGCELCEQGGGPWF